MAYLLFLSLQTWPDFATLSLLALGLFALTGKSRVVPRLGRTDLLAVGLFAVALCLSTLFSEDPGKSLNFLAYAAINVIVLLLAATQTRDMQWWILAACLSLIGIGHLILLVAYGGFPHTMGAEALIRLQPLESLRVPNDALIAGLCLPALAFVLLQINRVSRKLALFAFVAYTAAGVYCSYLLDSKVVLLSVIASLAAVVLVRANGRLISSHSVRLAFFAVIAMGLLTSLWFFGNQSTTRLGIWSHALLKTDTIAEVIVGSGPNTFTYDPVLAENQFDEDSRLVPWAHNLYLEAWTEQGLLGVAGILAMTLIPMMRAVKLADDGRRLFLLSSCLVFCLLALVELTLTRRFNFAFMCLLYGLSCVGERE